MNTLGTFRFRITAAALAVALVVALLPGATAAAERARRQDARPLVDFNYYERSPYQGHISVFTDPDTGCEYLMSYQGSITPRIGTDRQHICKAPAPAPAEVKILP